MRLFYIRYYSISLGIRNREKGNRKIENLGKSIVASNRGLVFGKGGNYKGVEIYFLKYFDGLMILQLFQMYYGRKPCDIEARKNQYIQHVKKLEEVKSGHTHFHRSLGRERKDVDNLLKLSHQIHGISLNQQFKRRQFIEIQSQRRSYNSIRSIVKSELNRKILAVPSKHKPNSYFLDQANLKLIDKIVNVKSQFNFKKQSLEKIITTRIRNDTAEDYSEIYQKSFINHAKIKRIHLKIGKSKLNNKISFHFLNQESLEYFKRDALFIIELQSNQKRKHSKPFQLSEILKSQIHVNFPDNEITLNFLQKIGERTIKRFKMSFTQTELKSEQRIWTSKVIEDTKNRAIGLVELQLKKRRDNISRNIFYDEIVQDLKQKENASPCVEQSL